jgi:hypothetical protein
VSAEHDAGTPGGGAASRAASWAAGQGHLAAERGRAGHAAVGQPGQQPLAQVIGPGGGQHGAGDHGRDERSRRQVPAHLLGHDQRLRQPEARAAEFFGHVQPEQAEAAELGPEGGQLFRPALEQAARRRAGLVLGQQAGHGLGEGAVLFRDGDRHG